MKSLSIKILISAILFFLGGYSIHAQELFCDVTINSDKVRTVDQSVFEDMENSFEQFLNQRRWTSDVYKNHEKLKCNLNLIIDDMPSIGQFSASIQIQSARPVFNTNYESILLNFADRNWQFEYVESQPLDFSENNFNSNLTSMLAFYAYIILGLDYDSFAELGGEDYFQKALNVVNNAQQTNYPGWKSLESNRNRYWLIENLTNQRMESIRSGFYKYHKQGIDVFTKDPDQSRQQILQVLKDLRLIKRQYPSSILVIAFIDAKSDELVNLFSEGDVQIRRQAYNLLVEINPTGREDYNSIVK